MINNANHDTLVTNQFGPRANAYLTSAVHASGADLDCMAELIGARPNAKALDVGCGGGHAAYRLAGLVKEVVACDLSEKMLAVVREEAAQRGLRNIVTQLAVAESLPQQDRAFDVAVTRYSAHHWRDVPAGLAQLRRVLAPNGIGVVMDVIAPEMPLLNTWLQSMELLRDPSHVCNGSLSQWTNWLAQAGFVIDAVHQFRLRLEFGAWVERIQTPPAHVQAIRSLQQMASAEVREYFALESDGSFTVDSVVIALR